LLSLCRPQLIYVLQLYQLLSDRFPFWDVDLHQIDSLGGMAIREGIMHGPVLFPAHPWSSEVHPSAQDLIMRMLQRNPEKRISAAEALAHPFFVHALEAVPTYA
jgi:calcium-dependent protein kinase